MTNIDNIDGQTDLHNGTLKRYKLNRPEQAEKFQTMSNWIQVLRTVNNKSRQLDEYSTMFYMYSGRNNLEFIKDKL